MPKGGFMNYEKFKLLLLAAFVLGVGLAFLARNYPARVGHIIAGIAGVFLGVLLVLEFVGVIQ
jgi:hypothetical protein